MHATKFGHIILYLEYVIKDANIVRPLFSSTITYNGSIFIHTKKQLTFCSFLIACGLSSGVFQVVGDRVQEHQDALQGNCF